MPLSIAVYQKHCILCIKLSSEKLPVLLCWMLQMVNMGSRLFGGWGAAGILLNSKVQSVAQLKTLICGLKNLHPNQSRGILCACPRPTMQLIG
jgi:hypothetical protein